MNDFFPLYESDYVFAFNFLPFAGETEIISDNHGLPILIVLTDRLLLLFVSIAWGLKQISNTENRSPSNLIPKSLFTHTSVVNQKQTCTS